MSQDVFEKLSQFGVIPVIAIESVDDALPLADALAAGGLPVAEITFRTAAAADVMQKLHEERPDVLLGAGTVLTVENATAAKNCGATFALAPGLNPEVVTHAQEIDLPFMPGVATASDVECGLSLGCKMLKFFPSELLGGTKMIRALAGPYGHTGVRFSPTGGVTADNLQGYLTTPTIAAVGGTWIAKKEHIAAGDWAGIEQRAREAVEIVAGCRR